MVVKVNGQDYTWQNFVEVNEVEFRLTKEDIITKIDGNYFILLNDSLVNLYFQEVNFPGNLKYSAFTLDSLGDKKFIQKYRDLPPEQIARLEALKKDSTVKRFYEYPDTKPYQLYTNPETNRTMKYYDIKRTKDGRYISEREFQSYKGNFKFIKRKRGGDFAMDTSIIVPPDRKSWDSLETAKDVFYDWIGSKAPFLNVKDIDGNTYTSDQLKGKIVVVNFWFLGCPPCIREMPQLNTLQEFYSKRKDIVFLGFTTDTEYRLRLFEENGYKFNYINIPNSLDMGNIFKLPYYPAHIIIDKEGVIQFAELGAADDIGKILSKAIDQVLKTK